MHDIMQVTPGTDPYMYVLSFAGILAAILHFSTVMASIAKIGRKAILS
jgi:hypothetical protein